MPKKFVLITLLGCALLLATARCVAALEFVWEVDSETLKHFKIEDPKLVRIYGDRAAIYLRFIPLAKKPIAVGFATKKNYLLCDGMDEHWEVEEIKQVFFDRREGIVVYGFFFPRPACDNVRFFVKPKILE